TKTDTNGRFAFDNLSTEPGYSYQVTTVFQEADYSSDWLDFSDGEIKKSIEIIVYDSTTSNEAIIFAMTYIVMYPGPAGLHVEESYLLANESDRTYIGGTDIAANGERATLRFTLPKQAVEPQYLLGLMECCVFDTKDGFIDTMPVLPGAKKIAYSYLIEHGSEKYTFSRMLDYPILNYELLIRGEGIEVNSQQLATGEPANINGIHYQHFSGRNFAAGETLIAQLSGLPKSGDYQAVRWSAILLTVLIGGFILIYLMKKRHVQPAVTVASPDQQKHRLIIELAQLDDDFEAGGMTEEVYRQQRAMKKAQLVRLMQETERYLI
ncbi:MAG: hypothetical protein KKF26_03905, partial [Chloroflexi bacterium]|nr:hypothetical protein [Chloroflexota bacterium]